MESKVFDSIVLDTMNPLLKQVIFDVQHGFSDGRSRVTNLLSLQCYVSDALGRRSPVDTIYGNFSKAFNMTNHPPRKA